MRRAHTLIVDAPMCEGLRLGKYANDPKDFESAPCSNRGRYVIDGRNLCAKHAGPIALQILLDMEFPDTGPRYPAFRQGVPCEDCCPQAGCTMNCGPSSAVDYSYLKEKK